MEIKQAMNPNSNSNSNRQIYVKYKPVSIYIGPNKRRTEVLCDLANEGNRPGGWTVCVARCILIYSCREPVVVTSRLV